VALGTFPVESHSANVLFDTGATHSFVTASWVETHNIPVAPMYPPMRVSSIGGRTQTDRFCPSERFQISGIEFPSDLIVMGTRVLGRRQRRHPSLEAFAAVAGLTETKRAGTPFAGLGTLTKACGDVFSRRGLVQSQGPRVIWPIVTGPAWPPLYYGPNL
jgi:hypothetical protein